MAEPQPADDWQPVAPAAPAAPQPPADHDDWQPVQQIDSTASIAAGHAVYGPTPDLNDPVNREIVATTGHMGRIWDAFKGGVDEGWGSSPLGMTDADVKRMQDLGLFRKEQNEGLSGVFRAFNELVFYRGAQALDGLMRFSTGTYRGAQEAVAQTGAELGDRQLGTDIARMPDAFLGTPHPMGIPRVGTAPMTLHTLQEGHDLGVVGPPHPPAEGAPAVVAQDAARPGAVPARESIASAAIKYKGETFTGVIHSDAYEAAAQKFDVGTNDVFRAVSKDDAASGFLTTAGRFVSREDAVKLAEEADQIQEKPRDQPYLIAQNLKENYADAGSQPQMSGPPRAAAASRAGDDVLRGPEPQGQPNAWRERFDQFATKVSSDDQAAQLLRDAADKNDNFPAARQGEIPVRQREDIAGAAGVPAASVDWDGAGRTMQNDNVVRNAMQAMLAARDAVTDAARAVRQDPSEANLQAMQEAMLRRDTWVEQVVGHRAEWGRTGNVFQEFMKATQEEQGFSKWMAGNDRTPEGLRKLAGSLDGMDPAQVPRFLSDANKPTFWDKAMWYWVNALISGPVTHAKYMGANLLFSGWEHGVVTPIAGAVGTARRALSGTQEGVFAGEAAPRLWGLVSAVPDALKAAVQAAKTGLQTPLPSELARGVAPKQNVAFSSNLQPIPGWFGKIIGIPSRGASAIHSFYNFLGDRASIEGQAYRAAAKEGLSPTGQDFWERQRQLAASPTDEMHALASEEAYRGTFISELGPAQKAVSNAVRKVPGGRLIMPFLHIPFNILSRAAEGVPGLNFLPEESRNDILGRNGAVKQDMAVARVVAGSAVGVWAMNKVVNGGMTGYGPMDPKERDQWFATGHQPYSIRINNEWVSFNRFGPVGTMLGLYSNLGEVIPHLKGDEDELTQAVAMTVHSTGRLLEDEVGMQGLAGLMNAIDDPNRGGTRYVSQFAGSWLPFSSALRQTASATDPFMRQTKNVVDGLRYYIPGTRQGLEPKRDWLGRPIPNAGYGGDLMVPGVSALLQHKSAVPDALGLEMQTLDLHPTLPRDIVGGVKLTPQLYDHYQGVAGPLTEMALDSLIRTPNWYSLPAVARQEAFRRTIEATRRAAAAQMQAQFPALIQAGVDQRMRQITGEQLSRSKKAPASLEGLQ